MNIIGACFEKRQWLEGRSALVPGVANSVSLNVLQLRTTCGGPDLAVANDSRVRNMKNRS